MNIRRCTEDLRRTHGIEVQIRLGLNSGEVMVRAIGSDLHMDYTAVSQTIHLAAHMKRMACREHPPNGCWYNLEGNPKQRL